MNSRLLTSFIFLFIFFCSSSGLDRKPNIAIIGGGIGGTSCAFFLNDLFEGKANISIYERNSVGGRLSLINVDGKNYEAGGSIIHSRNKYMKYFSKLLGVPAKNTNTDKFGLFNGQSFVFLESDIIGFTYLKLLWRYGLSVFRLPYAVDAMLNDFSRIYAAQEKKLAFTTVQSMLEYMNPSFPNMTQDKLASILERKGYSESFISELAQSIMLVNYGQTTNMSGFAGFVSLAGAGENLFSIEGGNKLVPEGLLKQSTATLINGDVIEINLLHQKKFGIKYFDISSEETLSSVYDIVILSAPLISGNKNIKFNNFKKSFQQFETPFHRTVATFVKGDLNKKYFQTTFIPEQILTFNQLSLFNSISVVHPASNPENNCKKKVYKIFSHLPLTNEDLNKLFKNIDMVKEKDWLAYPDYNPPEKLQSFFLYPGLYYTNAIELSASAMEMSAISAKNIALLSFNLWNNMIDNVDQHQRIYKEEL